MYEPTFNYLNLKFVCPFTFLSLCLSATLPVCHSLFLSLCFPVPLPFCPFACLTCQCLSLFPSVPVCHSIGYSACLFSFSFVVYSLLCTPRHPVSYALGKLSHSLHTHIHCIPLCVFCFHPRRESVTRASVPSLSSRSMPKS